MDFNAKTVCGGILVMALAIMAGATGCEPPAEPPTPSAPCWWHLTEEDFQAGPPDDKTCVDGGARD